MLEVEVVNWEYYNSHFPKVNEEEFTKLIYSASRFVLKKLSKNFEEYTEEQQIDIKDCICNVLNYQSEFSRVSSLSSVSNDGYSESYVQKETETQKADLDAIVYDWIGDLVEYFVCF